MVDDTGKGRFWLYDLRVHTVIGDRVAVCHHVEGDSFQVHGESLVFEEGQTISMYALAALLPLLPAKQRDTDVNDWMSTDAEIACPDPHCGARFRIVRTAKRWFSHAETTGLPDARSTPYWQKTGASE
ncbi:MAG: TIGR04076 family protein [Rhodobacteraceae bacterium]|nr:TIGR04076 family protein [Paracoccaceae bacterium]